MPVLALLVVGGLLVGTVLFLSGAKEKREAPTLYYWRGRQFSAEGLRALWMSTSTTEWSSYDSDSLVQAQSTMRYLGMANSLPYQTVSSVLAERNPLINPWAEG